MKRAYGSDKTPLIECINPDLRKFRIRWDYRLEEEGGVSFMEAETLYRPSMQIVREIVLNGYNEIVDERIISGFKWKGYDVWLSTENQFNYKAAFDLAVQTNGVNLPIKFKFGTTDNPQYYTFETVQDLGDFYGRAMGYINEQLQWGWETKDSIDWGEYERQLNAI